MTLVEDDNVIQTFTADRTDETLGVGVRAEAAPSQPLEQLELPFEGETLRATLDQGSLASARAVGSMRASTSTHPTCSPTVVSTSISLPLC